ncbi:hypothetical protein Hamer_G012210 [Homarus americanus]|uniref:Uncharacterized protein n=1 Tax=Homarus americanus TaxID=6706 RepID=A0A8J5KAK5_HOMAM|nr:hypothetical protein Hamer_G012210 [Homarus americanus]
MFSVCGRACVVEGVGSGRGVCCVK